MVYWWYMKILIAADLHWPTINGVATFSRNLAKGLSDRGHEVLVIAPSQTGKAYDEYDGNHVIKRTKSTIFPFYQNFRISPMPNKEVQDIITEFEPDVIHIQMMMWIGISAMKYGNKYEIPIVATNHAIPDNLLDNMRLIAPVSKTVSFALNQYGTRFFAKADYVTLPTQLAIDMMGGQERLPVAVEPVSNGIDLSRFEPTKASPKTYEEFGIPKNVPVISYIGRIDAEKHLSILLESFTNIRRSGSNAHLLIVGDGTDREHLQNRVYRLGLADCVTFTGRVSDDAIIALHKVGDIFCMPSPAELQSIATLEAMASGKPVIAVDAGALAELCRTGENGVLCEKDDAEGITDALQLLLGDKKLAAKYAKASLKIAKTHDINYTLDRFEAIYDQVISSKTRVLPQRLL